MANPTVTDIEGQNTGPAVSATPQPQMPIGNLLAGAASHRFGVQRTLATGGLIIAVFVITYVTIFKVEQS